MDIETAYYIYTTLKENAEKARLAFEPVKEQYRTAQDMYGARSKEAKEIEEKYDYIKLRKDARDAEAAYEAFANADWKMN